MLAFELLPALLHAADSELLVPPLTDHLEETRVHAERVEQLMLTTGGEPTSAASRGLEALWKSYEERHDGASEPRLADLVVIDSAVRTEHLELAVYESLAPLLGGIGVAPEPLEQVMRDERRALDELGRVRKALLERLPRS